MAKKIFALVLTACVLGAFIGGCGSKDDAAGGTAGTAGSAGTAGGGTAGTK